MAETITSESKKFALRVKIRQSIVSKNKRFAQYTSRINYGFSAANTLLMESFHGGINRHIESLYAHDKSPIDTLDLIPLAGFSMLLNRVLKKWSNVKHGSKDYTKVSFENLIKDEAKKVRKLLSKINGLPEHNNQATPLPARISGKVLKNAEQVLEKHNNKLNNPIYAIIDNDPKHKPRKTLSKRDQKLVEKTVETTLVKIEQNPKIIQLTDAKQNENITPLSIFDLDNELEKHAPKSISAIEKESKQKERKLKSLLKEKNLIESELLKLDQMLYLTQAKLNINPQNEKQIKKEIDTINKQIVQNQQRHNQVKAEITLTQTEYKNLTSLISSGMER